MHNIRRITATCFIFAPGSEFAVGNERKRMSFNQQLLTFYRRIALGGLLFSNVRVV